MLYVTVVYKENIRVQLKLFPTNTLTQHYTQLANYHLPKFAAGISKKANISRQSTALLLMVMENA